MQMAYTESHVIYQMSDKGNQIVFREFNEITKQQSHPKKMV